MTDFEMINRDGWWNGQRRYEFEVRSGGEYVGYVRKAKRGWFLVGGYSSHLRFGRCVGSPFQTAELAAGCLVREWLLDR